jgi:hypothetical protein
VASPEWELTDADTAGVAYLSLPADGQEVRGLLRGESPRHGLEAAVSEPGRFADIHSLGWPGLYALSPRMATTLGRFAGVVLRPLKINDGPNDYVLLGATGRCGPVDYRKSVRMGQMGEFVRLRGLHVGEMQGTIDLAVPPNLETIVVTSRVHHVLGSCHLDNVRLRSLKDQEFHVPEEEVTAHTDR